MNGVWVCVCPISPTLSTNWQVCGMVVDQSFPIVRGARWHTHTHTHTHQLAIKRMDKPSPTSPITTTTTRTLESVFRKSVFVHHHNFFYIYHHHHLPTQLRGPICVNPGRHRHSYVPGLLIHIPFTHGWPLWFVASSVVVVIEHSSISSQACPLPR